MTFKILSAALACAVLGLISSLSAVAEPGDRALPATAAPNRGASRGQFKIADNESPRPQDRRAIADPMPPMQRGSVFGLDIGTVEVQANSGASSGTSEPAKTESFAQGNPMVHIRGRAGSAPTGPDAWRFQLKNGEWWYYGVDKKWLVHRNNKWVRYVAPASSNKGMQGNTAANGIPVAADYDGDGRADIRAGGQVNPAPDRAALLLAAGGAIAAEKVLVDPMSNPVNRPAETSAGGAVTTQQGQSSSRNSGNTGAGSGGSLRRSLRGKR